MNASAVGYYERVGTDIKCLRSVLERVEAGHDIFCSSDFERGGLEAQGTSRCLHLAHFQHRSRGTDIGQNRQMAKTRDNLAQQFESLASSIGLLQRQASNVSAGSRETGDEAGTVTLAGHDIFKGRALLKPSTPTDYSNFIVACLAHDIGYVRGVVKGDKDDGYVIDRTGRKISLPRGSSDAALGPYHVERSQLFVLDRVAAVEELDSARIARAIGFTRFPYPSPTDEKEDEQGIDEEGSLLRAADLIGQLGDPHYLRKANALYYEFEEIGLNRQFGYESPADIVDKYPQFYWNNVSPHIQTAIDYLNVTSSGRWWIAGLYSNVFRAERELRHSGPQP